MVDCGHFSNCLCTKCTSSISCSAVKINREISSNSIVMSDPTDLLLSGSTCVESASVD